MTEPDFAAAYRERRVASFLIGEADWLSPTMGGAIRALCLPLRVEFPFANVAFEVQATGPCFEPATPGMSIPRLGTKVVLVRTAEGVERHFEGFADGPLAGTTRWAGEPG